MTTQTNNIQKADTRKTSSLLKKYFKNVFGTDVKIKTEKYSMGCSLNINYQLGPDEEVISSVAKKLQYGAFDSNSDYGYTVQNEGLIIEGYDLESWRFVFVKQELSPEFRYTLAKFLSDKMKFEDVFPLTSISEFHTHFKERYNDSWTWSDLIRSKFKTKNFVTQDESKINLISVHESEKDNGRIYFIYEVGGKQYNTEIYTKPGETKEEKKETSSPVATPGAPENVIEVISECTLIDYSEKGFAVTGEKTKVIKDQLHDLGGSFNYRLKCGPGWIFSKKKLEAVKSYLHSLK